MGWSKALWIGELINKLLEQEPHHVVTFDSGGYPGKPHSWRGYYHWLAFEATDERIDVAEFVALLKSCIGREFTGYKGGEYKMDEHTLLYHSEWGESTEMAISDVVLLNGRDVTLVTVDDSQEYDDD